jgi:hypothetical protein
MLPVQIWDMIVQLFWQKTKRMTAVDRETLKRLWIGMGNFNFSDP